MIDPVKALLEAKRFNKDADQLFMLYRDALGATRAEYKRYSKFDPDIYIEYQSEGRANAPSTVREYLARNAPDGDNERWLGNSLAITLFELWEHKYRPVISKALDARDSIAIPAFGDLRLIRNAIVHPAGNAIRDLGKLEVLRWFSEGDEISLSPVQVEEIIGTTRSMLMQFVTQQSRSVA